MSVLAKPITYLHMTLPDQMPLRQAIADVFQELRRRRAKKADREVLQRELAREIGVTQPYISRIENGAVDYDAMPLATVERLARGYRFELADWPAILRGETPDHEGAVRNKNSHGPSDEVGIPSVTFNDNFVTVQVYGSVVAGNPNSYISEAPVIDTQIIPRSEYRNGNTFPVYVSGDSMEPTIHDGELVVADRALTELKDDTIYLIAVEGEEMPCVKRARLRGTQWWLESDNRRHKAFQPEQAVIIGEVYWVQPKGRRPS